MMKICFVLATCVTPPARCRYHPAALPGTKVMAEALNTCPVTSTKPGTLGNAKDIAGAHFNVCRRIFPAADVGADVDDKSSAGG